ncbi:MAG: FAD-dependent oxidoreductase [Acidimicrobiia bacterium]|nr:FAD-dependent oxidoreductase [Acidimicrobiia bacterium]
MATDAAGVVVVGASLAGVHAVRSLRSEGFGGTITVIDGQPHTPYDRPPLSKGFLAGDDDAAAIRLGGLDELDVTWRLGTTAVGLDVEQATVTLANGTLVPFDGLVLAPGAVPRRLPGTDELPMVRPLRDLDDALALRAVIDGAGGQEASAVRVVVVGAGFIGAEVAATCRDRGVEVTMVEMATVPLEAALGRHVGGAIAALHRQHGVDLRLGASVEGIDPVDDRRCLVRCTDGEPVVADAVVVGIGVEPATEWLASSGVRLDNGIVTDERLAAAARIVVAGDALRWPSGRTGSLERIEHWEHAVATGEAAGRRLAVELAGGDVDALPVFDPVPWFWSDQYDRKLQLAGRAGVDHDMEVAVGGLDEDRFVAVYGRGGRATGVFGMNRPRHVALLRQRLDGDVSVADLVEAAAAL